MNSQQVNFAVHDLATAIRFYSAMFASAPAVLKPDCAKWMLNDPRVSFTIFAPDAARGETTRGRDGSVWGCSQPATDLQGCLADRLVIGP